MTCQYVNAVLNTKITKIRLMYNQDDYYEEIDKNIIYESLCIDLLNNNIKFYDKDKN
jgi:hypothetical protein